VESIARRRKTQAGLDGLLIRKKATPAGFERTQNDAKQREDSSSPSETGEARSSKNRVETLSGSKVARMAAVASNAVRNFDLIRAIDVLDELRRMGEGEA